MRPRVFVAAILLTAPGGAAQCWHEQSENACAGGTSRACQTLMQMPTKYVLRATTIPPCAGSWVAGL
jgi:hypothetical protein